jgi:hypothetical protein
MISKNDILNFVKHVHRKGQGVPDRNPMHPHREWFIGLLLFVLLTLVGMVMSIRAFETYKNIGTKAYEVDVVVPSYNQTLARTALQLYVDRDAAYAQLINEVPLPQNTEVEVPSTTASSTPGTTASTTASSTAEVVEILPETPADSSTSETFTDEAEADAPVMTFE